MSDFQDAVANFVLYYGDGRLGPSAVGLRATGFDLDSKVQLFETVIRGVGGLLSAHLFSIGELPIPGYDPSPASPASSSSSPRSSAVIAGADPLELPPILWPNGFAYDGQLLRLALDLARRLLPAFYTPTGIPYPRVNLRTGIPFYVNSPLHQLSPADGATSANAKQPQGPGDITETCSAGAGSLTLEFTVLSRLTGDPRFELAAKRAFWEVWRRRSKIGLIGNGIDAEHGMWIGPHAGIGAGMDSFFEYALKSHILLSGHGPPNFSSPRPRAAADWLDPGSLHGPLPPEMHSSEAFLEAWHQAHASVKRHLYTNQSHYPYYSNSHRATGQPYTMWIDSLGAFYPGLLALAGEVEEAIEANLVYTALWTRYSGLPERWSVAEGNVEAGIGWWPGRPEFVESTYHIYRATRDPWYLHVGEMVLRDIWHRCFVPCGWAGLQDVRTGEKQDRMESFFLGETAKYMYLLFDPDHPLNKLDAAYVFTTEGHPLILPRSKPSGPLPSSRPNAEPVASFDPSPGRDRHTHTCPSPAPPLSWSGSLTAARPQLFDASRFTDLYNTPNLRGPVEAFEVEDETRGRVTLYRAASNHSLFPWTLPPTMLPPNGTCLAPPRRLAATIQFPSGDALFPDPGPSLVWRQHAGPTVTKLDGLRLRMEREQQTDGSGQPSWRVTHVGNTNLGRHETVFFFAEKVAHLRDEAFSCRRRDDSVQIELLMERASGYEATPAPASATGAPPGRVDMGTILPESLFQQLLRVVSSVFEPPQVGGASEAEAQPPAETILSLDGRTSVGRGAFPVPSVPDAPTAETAESTDDHTSSGRFPWKTVFLAGQACGAPLPEEAPRHHHLIVMRRGGCSFDEKLRRIPSFGPSQRSLKLVVVVDEDAVADDADEDDDDGDDGDEDRRNARDPILPRPLLEAEQFTPGGLRRLHSVPMVLVRGAAGDYRRFGTALAVGMRRRYQIESQGLAVANAVVI